MPKPVVAAVNGPAVGIGCSLALAADLIVAAESAYFLLAFVNIGLVPDGGSTAFLPARVGYARAAEMAMLGERVPATQALEWGLINRVVADDELEAGPLRAARAARQGPDRLLRRLEAPAQPAACTPTWPDSSTPRPRRSAIREKQGLRRGRRGVRREARAELHRFGGRSAPESWARCPAGTTWSRSESAFPGVEAGTW